MPTLFSWYIRDHGPAFLAHGIVSGHPKLPDGIQVHTSAIARMTEEERGILLETRSGSLYHLRPEELDSRGDLPAPGALGLSPDLWQRCARARELADREEEAALSALHAPGVLRLRVVRTTVLSALWSGRDGLARRAQIAEHLGMFQDSVLIWAPSGDESGSFRLDFRYFPYFHRIEPYKVSEDIETILIVNEGARDVAFGTGENICSCAAGTTTEIDAKLWRDKTS